MSQLLSSVFCLLSSSPAQSGPGHSAEQGFVAIPIREAPKQAGTLSVRSGEEPTPLDQETIDDLAYYATESGKDLDQLLKQHAGITEFSEFTTQLEQTRPGLYVRSGLSELGEDSGYWLELTREPSPGLVEAISQLPVDVDVQYGSPASSAELARLSAALVSSLSGSSIGITTAKTSYDHDTYTMKVEYAAVGSSDTKRALNRSLKSVAASFRGELPVEVVYERVEVNAVTETTVQGGRNLDLPNGNAACTAGFTAERENGNQGVLTARHCNNNVEYNGVPGVISTSPSFPNLARVDFQFHRTLTRNGHDTNKQFRATCNDGDCDRVVLSAANAPMGSLVCHWGRTSGYSCSEIVDQDTCVLFDNGENWCGLDVTRDDISSGGDSGGPWFLGQIARGGHTGAASGEESYLTRIGRLQYLNAKVLQN